MTDSSRTREHLEVLADGLATPGEGSAPPRGPLSPEVEKAARRIHFAVWGSEYEPGRGPMHYAGGPYWRGRLLEVAASWERMAEAARVCASVLPGEQHDRLEER